jgi:deoxycytidine triphosphate deaminase
MKQVLPEYTLNDAQAVDVFTALEFGTVTMSISPGAVLPDTELWAWALSGGVEPFDELSLNRASIVNPASVDLRLADKIRLPAWYWSVPIIRRWAWRKRLPLWGPMRTFTRYTLQPGGCALCCSLETTRIPDDCTAWILSKSSTGRTMLEHMHAGYGDPGFTGQWTFEFKNEGPWPIELVAGKRTMQLVLIRMTQEPQRGYSQTGRYQHQRNPTPARESNAG